MQILKFRFYFNHNKWLIAHILPWLKKIQNSKPLKNFENSHFIELLIIISNTEQITI